MDKKELMKCLEKVFLNDFSPDPTTYLSKLLSLVSYYSDEDFTSELQEAFNQLNAVLVSIELVKKVGYTKPFELPRSYECRIDSYHNQVPNNFTFAPTFNIPELKDVSFPKKQIDEIVEEVRKIDIASLVAYVKAKAVASGDFTFEA